MRHPTPLAALETLERELTAVAGDVTHGAATLGRRLETIIQLLPVIGAAAQMPQHAGDLPAVRRTLEAMREQHDALAATLRGEIARLGAELGQLRTGQEASERYAVPATVPARAPQLDVVG